MIYKSVVLSLLLVQVYSMNYPSPLKYFNKTDASQITWSHRTNSQEALTKALEDSTMMIEADVLMGKVGDAEEVIPIMAHPPNTTSDLSLEEFLYKVKTSKDLKGIKLDFKDVGSVKPSLELVEQKLSEHDLPLMLNADILRGPVNKTEPLVPAEEFLSQCKKLAPAATLSVGWTTNIPEKYTGELFYGKEYAVEMNETLESYNITQPLTFPVRAAMCSIHHGCLKELVDANQGNTLTVWSLEEDGDYIDYNSLVQLQERLGKNRVYLDLPQDQMYKFEDLAGGSPRATAALPLMLASLCLVWLLL